MKKNIIIALVTFFSLFSCLITTRSTFRKRDPNTPEITIGWRGAKTVIKRTDWHFTEYPIFTIFNKEFFYNHMVPKEGINYGPEKKEKMDTILINRLVEKLLKEIKRRKQTYTDFVVICKKNFNTYQKCGLIILKFKNYPFILKLFIETPSTFIDPHCKGFKSQFLFYMSGGINRLVAGFTRIKNLEIINELIAQHPYWKGRVITPRKWYWLPRKQYWLEIKGRNIGEKPYVSTQMPGIYAIIADELDTVEYAPTLSSHQRSELVMHLCMDLHLFVDPHSDNFVIHQSDEEDSYTISIVDTEHFPSIVGLKEEPFFTSHLEWGLYLTAKYIQDAFLQTKQDLREAQAYLSPHALI